MIYHVNYNSKGRANSISTANSTHQFAYDPNDYRIRKDNQLYHLEGKNLEATYSQTGELKNNYFRGVVVDEIVSGYSYHSQAPGDWTNYTFHHDHLNSVTALTGHAGSIKETTRYDAFGEILNQTNNTGNDLLFTGRERDQTTGLIYYRARYYDPEIGRFITEDPLGFQAGINFYAYVNNNPVNFNDPSGKDAATLGLSFRLFGTGISMGGEVRFPGITHEPFDLGVNGSFTPGFIGEKLIGLIDPENPFANASKGIDFARLTLDIGLDTMPREQSSIIGVEVFAGAPVSSPLVGIGVTALFDANQKGSFPTGGQINLGPQLRGGANLQLQGSLTVRDVVDFGKDAVNFISDQFTSAAGGGFVIYPSKPNTNTLQSVYSK